MDYSAYLASAGVPQSVISQIMQSVGPTSPEAYLQSKGYTQGQDPETGVPRWQDANGNVVSQDVVAQAQQDYGTAGGGSKIATAYNNVVGQSGQMPWKVFALGAPNPDGSLPQTPQEALSHMTTGTT